MLVLDGRGERASHLAGRYREGDLEVLHAQELPHSLGLLYEEVTEHLGFLRSSDEYKVMAMASYGEPAYLGEFRELVTPTGDGGFRIEPVEWGSFAKRLGQGEQWTPDHANLAASVQRRLEEVLLELASWLHNQTGDRELTMAGGVALNCVANTVLAQRGPFERIWVQPAAGDSGTALGAALHVAHALGDTVEPMAGADLGRGWTDAEIEAWLLTANVAHDHPMRWTSLGLSLLEAMHLGMPVVALATTEAGEAVPPGAGVWSNRPAVLAGALHELIAEPERARAVGRVARDAALARYGLARFLAERDALLAEVTS